MKTLYLLRHAKSSWDDPNLEDFQRPLNKRGRKAAKLMAEYFRRSGIQPQLVLCSPARRTRQTFELLAPVLGDARVTFDERIYEASRQTLVARIAELPPLPAEVLLIGHNPGLERLALHLGDHGDDDAAAGKAAPHLARLRDKYPTCGLTTIVSQADAWDAINPANSRLENFIRPVDLGDIEAELFAD